MKKRTIVRVNREALERQANSHLDVPMEIEDSPSQRGLESIFD
jgi:hypothetical protein